MSPQRGKIPSFLKNHGIQQRKRRSNGSSPKMKARSMVQSHPNKRLLVCSTDSQRAWFIGRKITSTAIWVSEPAVSTKCDLARQSLLNPAQRTCCTGFGNHRGDEIVLADSMSRRFIYKFGDVSMGPVLRPSRKSLRAVVARGKNNNRLVWQPRILKATAPVTGSKREYS